MGLSGEKTWEKWLWPLVIGLAAFAAVAPTLLWLDFTNGMENFNVLTSIEMVRDGHWLLPTLNGAPRLQKPPLAQWITAWGIASGGPLTWAARWPSLLMGAMLPLVAGAAGRLVGGQRMGVLAALMIVGNVFFLKYARRASYDIQLALWVALTTYFLLLCVIRGSWWTGCLGAGAGLGLALMTKGPVALAETIAPLALWLGMLLWLRRGAAKSSSSGGSIRWGALAAGMGVMLAIGLPWVMYVLSHVSAAQLAAWKNELSMAEEQAEGLQSRPWEVLIFLGLFVPWTICLVVGLISCWTRRRGRDGAWRGWMALAWAVPLGIISLVPPIRDRYLLPMIFPAALLAAWGWLELFDDQNIKHHRRLIWLHGIFLSVAAIALPVAGATVLRRADGQVWYSWWEASGWMAALGAAAGWSLWRPLASWWRVPVAATAMLLILQAAYYAGARYQAGERSDSKVAMAALAKRYPGARFWMGLQHAQALELSIYLNRVVRPWTGGVLAEQEIVLVPEALAERWSVKGRVVDRFVYNGEPWRAIMSAARKED